MHDLIKLNCEFSHLLAIGTNKLALASAFKDSQGAFHFASMQETAGGGIDVTLFDVILFEWTHEYMPLFLHAQQVCASANKPFVAIGSSNTTDSDQVAAFTVGCDDFILLPLNPMLFVARINRLLSHFQLPRLPHTVPSIGASTAETSPIYLNALTQCVVINGMTISLTQTELRVLHCFLENPDRCLNRQELLETVWDISYDPGTNIVDAMIYGLRKKLKSIGQDHALETVRGKGYRFNGPAIKKGSSAL